MIGLDSYSRQVFIYLDPILIYIKLFILVGLGRSFFVCCLAHRSSNVGFLLLQCSSGVVRHPRDLQVSVATRFCRVLIFASSQYLSVIYLFHVMIHWWVKKTSTRTEQLYVLSHDRSWGRGWVPVKPVWAPQYFYTDRSKAVLLLWFLTVTCSWCLYLYFGSAIMLVTYFVNFR